jgi:hypothetical protein
MDAVVTPIGIAQIVWRNSAPIVGILFFHWSTTNVLVLYFHVQTYTTNSVMPMASGTRLSTFC